MKAWSVAMLSGLLGAAVAVGAVWRDFSGGRASFDMLRSQASVDDAKPVDTNEPARGRARLELEGEAEYEFGVMTVGETDSHVFPVRNVGTAPLTLRVRETTCMCTDVTLPPDPVAPGETADVALHWRVEGRDLAYRHSATLETSDPLRRTLKLSISGQVRRIVLAIPSEVTFNRVLSHKVNEAKVAIHAYRHDDLAIVHAEFLHEETRELFQFDWRPLAAQEFADQAGVKSGVMVTITTKPGLPLGPINQRVRLDFEALDLDPFTIPIGGSVVSDITLATAYPKFDRESYVLKLGHVPANEVVKVDFSVWVKGPHRDKVSLTPEEIFPNDLLRVTVGQPEKSPSGAAVKIPLTVQVSAGTRLANHLGTKQGKIGRITFDTNHPEAPTLRLYVSFMVGDFD
jgi:hypothetical protein